MAEDAANEATKKVLNDPNKSDDEKKAAAAAVEKVVNDLDQKEKEVKLELAAEIKTVGDKAFTKEEVEMVKEKMESDDGGSEECRKESPFRVREGCDACVGAEL